MHGYDGGDWLWMTLGMGFWLALLGVVVYLAVVLALRHPGGGGDDRGPRRLEEER